ncbi:hypothetical protein BGZ88_006496 [Linnemannia elongata]|nr:hypothetical protein BGZ88_006496 [Linnemannia elongata]
MSYDPGNSKDNNNNKKRQDHDNDSYGGYRGEPNSNGQNWYKHNNKSRDSRDKDRSPSDRDHALYDERRDSYSRDRYDKNRDRSSSDSKKYDDSDSSCHRHGRRQRHRNNRNRHKNPSRSPTRGRETDRDRGKRESGLDKDGGKGEDTSSNAVRPSRGNIRTDFTIYQEGLFYSDRKAHAPALHHHSPDPDHHAKAYIKREEPPLRDGPSSSLQSPLPSLSPTAKVAGPPSSSTPKTTSHQSSTSQPPPRQSATLISSAIHLSTATSVTTATAQGGITSHVQSSQLTAHSAVLQDHRQLQEVHPQAPPQGRRSKLVSAAVVAYKALHGVLHEYEQQTGIPTADISVATILGKRSVGRPSKVRLENEETALLGIKRAKSEIKELERAPKQLHGAAGQAGIVGALRRADINKTDTPGHSAHLSITPTVVTNPVSRRQNPTQDLRRQEYQPMRALKARREQNSSPEGLSRRSKPAREALPQQQSLHIAAPTANTIPRKVINKTSQAIHFYGEASADKDKETQSDWRKEGYLGSPHLEWKSHKKGGTLDGQIAVEKSTPLQPAAYSTLPPVALKQQVQYINTQRESSHAEEIVQVQHTDSSETGMCSSTNKTASTTLSSSVQSKRSPTKNGPAQDRYNNLFLRKKATGKERSYTGQKRQPVTRRDRQPSSDDSDDSIDHRSSTVACHSSLILSKPRRRVTFADLKTDDEAGSRDSQDDATDLSKPSSPTIHLPVHGSDALEPLRSVLPSPLPLDSLTLPPSPFVQEETFVNDDMIISPASSPVLSSFSVAPIQASHLRGNSASKVNVELATNSQTTMSTSESPAEIEKARKRVLALMEQLDAVTIAEPTTTTMPTSDSDKKKSADAIATELSTEMKTVDSDEQAPHATTQEFSQTPASDAKNNPTASIAHRQADDEAARDQAIERTEATPASYSTPVYSHANSFSPATSFTSTPHYGNTARLTYGYWCQCAMKGRPCVCEHGTYNSAPAPPDYYHSYTQHTTHTRTDYFYAHGQHYPTLQHTFHSSHQNAWSYHPPPWTRDHHRGQPWPLPPPPPSTFFGHTPPAADATQSPFLAGAPTSASSQPASIPAAGPSNAAN